ncbi:MAG: UDP-N-acetylmuramoyl-L-alanyl-D-glutamate--2,6-diaminopimelate ligase [Bacteroidetes bacterium]|nr:MAG: UDP-N-acetylmuramoyl-L-alanyl-D-glutamate--2,6-diaminopimelate ligase [Bacteroidota bacterium]REK34792.1 MAG: UDP-N-acetylmuramoyl-L-alanyl-D-glutamate--2,6-diaminopimelate ligase [Bacteroidota bacterium]REK51329.1 MAG: UDP-N-acetylmuramoyl-L-alanyl-D-glutamate--2,6-diaminopimelate ligase [Bacteroidota bacterium]
MKILKDIIYKAGIVEISGSTAINIIDVTFDSRSVKEGSLFIAVKGLQSDGHNFIEQVIASGAVAVVCEKLPDILHDSVVYIRVNDSSLALAQIAANYHGNPSEKLKLIGITGTNGKTTTATLLFSLFRKLGYSCGLLSTVKNMINEQIIPATHTTPDPLKLNALLSAMVDEECEYCFMEVSSHSVVQNRVSGLNFAAGVFTNITHDHLDYHKTFDAYLKAKKGFFDMLPSGSFALVNSDDRNSKVMLQNTKASKYSYGLHSMCDYRCKLLENEFTGMLLNLDGQELHCRLVGSFNAYNITAVYAVARLLGKPKMEVLTELSNLEPVEGRFDYVSSQKNIIGVVDYAHTPDALQNVLNTINDVRSGKGRIITIVGCGGDRDASKRPVMAKIAAELSDRIILTSDNPRSEDPGEIISQMEKGIPASDSGKSLSIVDRKEAIKTAVALAQPGDIILLAGKGHEKYQEIKGKRTPFDDKQILSELLKSVVK